jgi:hypothetical protein
MIIFNLNICADIIPTHKKHQYPKPHKPIDLSKLTHRGYPERITYKANVYVLQEGYHKKKMNNF